MQSRHTVVQQVGQPVLLSQDAKLVLLAERHKVIVAIAVNPLDGCYLGEIDQESDYASIDQMRDVEFSHREALSKRLHLLDEALERIHLGAYGLCIDCGARIIEKRLTADPAVAFCVDCQAASESPTAPLTM